MGILNRWLNLDDVRGVRLHLDAPTDFTWSDETLPITLTFENRGDDDMVAVEIQLEIERDGSSDGPKSQFIRILPVRELIRSGETVVRAYPIPLTLDDRLVDPSHEGQVPGWMSGLLRRYGTGTTGFTGRCELEVKVAYEDVKRPGVARARIRAHRP